MAGAFFWGSAVLDELGNIYVTELNRVVSYRGSGVLNWRISLGGIVWDSPAVGTGGIIYAASYPSTIFAIDHLGGIMWKFPTGGRVWSSPVIDENGNLYFGDDTGAVYAVKADGSSLWTFKTDAKVSASLVAGRECVYCADIHGVLYALKYDGSERWRQKLGGAVYGAPLLTDKGILVVPTSRRLLALQIQDRPAQSPWPMYRRNIGRTGSLY